jgi:hypothetical protein
MERLLKVKGESEGIFTAMAQWFAGDTRALKELSPNSANLCGEKVLRLLKIQF